MMILPVTLTDKPQKRMVNGGTGKYLVSITNTDCIECEHDHGKKTGHLWRSQYYKVTMKARE